MTLSTTASAAFFVGHEIDDLIPHHETVLERFKTLIQGLATFSNVARDDSRNLDRDWVHDRFEGDSDSRRPYRGSRNRAMDQYSPEPASNGPVGAKLRVDNLHYDLTEEDLKELFERIGRVVTVTILYDRSDRSQGIAFVTYYSLSDARAAIREFDGANAYGQPIRLNLMQAPPSAAPLTRPARNPFDTAIRPSRSLFERIEEPASGRRHRSSSPGPPRHSDVSRPAPSNIDRYVPGQRRRSPPQGRGSGRAELGRRPGVQRDDSGRRGNGRFMVQGRPRKTTEELDAEMEDYWTAKGGAAQQSVAVSGDGVQNGGTAAGAAEPRVATIATLDDDIDMIE